MFVCLPLPHTVSNHFVVALQETNPSPFAGQGVIWIGNVGMFPGLRNYKLYVRLRNLVSRLTDPVPLSIAEHKEHNFYDLLSKFLTQNAGAPPLQVRRVVYRLREGGMFVSFPNKDEAGRAAHVLRSMKPEFLGQKPMIFPVKVSLSLSFLCVLIQYFLYYLSGSSMLSFTCFFVESIPANSLCWPLSLCINS